MLRLLALPAALLTVALALAQTPPKPAEVAKLVEQLGSADFREREAATRRLEELGPAAIEELRAAVTSDNPETARRAHDLLRKAERRLANDKTLAPTLVELDAKESPLDDALADLSKQAKCEVVLGGSKPAELVGKKVSVSTGGKVPFWAAVLKVCDAADLQIASAGGFLAPGAAPYRGRAARDANQMVVLEPRGAARRRPAAVHGGILVEAVPFPPSAVLDRPAALFQVWPEPRLRWESTTALRVGRATAADGSRLVAESAPPKSPLPGDHGGVVPNGRGGVILVRNPDGTARAVAPGEFEVAGGFRPHARQTLVRFEPGEKPAGAAKELSVAVFGTVRTGVEPVCQIRGLKKNKPETANGPGETTVTVRYGPDGAGGLSASVEVTYDPRAVHPVGVGDDLPDVKPGAAGVGNHTVSGIRVTDADGKPYILGLSTGLTRRDPTGRSTLILQLVLDPGKGEIGLPDTVTFWGTYLKPVEVPVILADVPLAGK
jgi:hypothetical protein